MKEKQHKGTQKPSLSYSKIEGKPLLANQEAIEAAVEYLNKHDAYYYQELPEFEATQKFKDYYLKEYDKEPTQEDIQEYVKGLILECEEEDKKIQEEQAKAKADLAKVKVSLGNEEKEKKDDENS